MGKAFLLASIIIINLGWSNLLTNGNFEQPLTTGWLRDSNVTVNFIIDRATHYDPDSDFEAQVYKWTGTGYAKLYQRVDIPSVQLAFSCNTKLIATTTSSTCWAGTALVIGYLNAGNTRLGETMICARTPACPWQNTPTRHLRIAPDTLWRNYAFNISDELTNLPGVNPSQIARIEIALYSECYSG
jgi:hypothetical protein